MCMNVRLFTDTKNSSNFVSELTTIAFFSVLYCTANGLFSLNIGCKHYWFFVPTLFSASYKRSVHSSTNLLC